MNKYFSFFLPNSFHFLQNVGGRFATQEGSAFLYSGSSLDSAAHSFFSLFPEETLHINCSFEDPWSALKERLPLNGCDNIPEWVGFFSYELGLRSDRDVKIEGVHSEFPLALFYKPSCVVKIHHTMNICEIYLTDSAPSFVKAEDFWLKLCENPLELCFEASKIFSIQHSDYLEGYIQKINEIKEWILKGDVYQANLSQEFIITFEKPLDTFLLYLELLKVSPTPFSAYINCGNFTIVSTSPERLLKKEGQHLETRPIKGTAPRGKNSLQDELSIHYLQNSSKERSELLMITDLMRNDLSKVSCAGSVDTQEMWRIEKYTNVFHLISVIQSRCKSGLHPIDLIRELFPGGSITGCPKLKAMELIANLEKRARQIYTGSIGYFTSCGDFDFNIAIRTLLISKNQVSLQLGGGIVLDSEPQKEFEETLHKGSSLFKVLDMRELIL